jgi:8-oxo-dGTP diphosphatase
MISLKAGETDTAFRAVGCFCIHNGKVLLVQRQLGKRYELHWGIPTGKIEAGETPSQCMTRELMEEVGIASQLEELVPMATYLVDDRGPVFEYDAFVLELSSAPEIVLQQDELRAFEWLPLGSTKRPVVPFFYNTLADLISWLDRGTVRPRSGPEPDLLEITASE